MKAEEEIAVEEGSDDLRLTHLMEEKDSQRVCCDSRHCCRKKRCCVGVVYASLGIEFMTITYSLAFAAISYKRSSDRAMSE